MQSQQLEAHEVLGQVARQPELLLTRSVELMDLLTGFEQARQMMLQDGQGHPLLALTEEQGRLGNMMLRQLFDSSRAFAIYVYGVPYLSELKAHGGMPDPEHAMFAIKREFPWLDIRKWLAREILVHDQQDRVVAGVTRIWHPWLRVYELYHAQDSNDDSDEPVLTMFGQVAVPFWSAIFRWEYPVSDAGGDSLTAVHRIFGAGLQGLATQVFTEKGNYYMPFPHQPLTLFQRLAVVSCAISIDYDFFSHRAGGGGWLWPMMILGGGGDE